MRAGFWVGIFFLVIAPCVFSQNTNDSSETRSKRTPKNRNVNIGIGLVNYNYKDFIVSPLVYSGTSYLLKLGYASNSQRKTNDFHFTYGRATLTNKQPAVMYPEYLLHAYFEGSSLYTLRNWHQWKFRLGYFGSALVDVRDNEKFMNSSTMYNTQFDIGPKIMFDRVLFFKKQERGSRKNDRYLKFYWQFSMPVVSWLSRPPYNGISQLQYSDQDLVKQFFKQEYFPNTKFYTLNHYLRLNNTIALEYYFKNQNSIRLSYISDVVRFNIDHRELQYSNGGFMFTIVFKLDNNKLIF